MGNFGDRLSESAPENVPSRLRWRQGQSRAGKSQAWAAPTRRPSSSFRGVLRTLRGSKGFSSPLLRIPEARTLRFCGRHTARVCRSVKVPGPGRETQKRGAGRARGLPTRRLGPSCSARTGPGGQSARAGEPFGQCGGRLLRRDASHDGTMDASGVTTWSAPLLWCWLHKPVCVLKSGYSTGDTSQSHPTMILKSTQ